MRSVGLNQRMSGALRLGSLAALMAFGAALSPALAQEAGGTDCQGDIGKLQQKREAQIASLNSLSKSGKGKLDPVAACPKLKTLASIESQILSYMTKNQSWCDIPDNVLQNVKEGRDKTSGFAGQACKFAAMARKAQQQAASGAGQGAPPVARLPTGPL